MVNLFTLQICIERLSFVSSVLSTGERGYIGEDQQVPVLMEVAF